MSSRRLRQSATIWVSCAAIGLAAMSAHADYLDDTGFRFLNDTPKLLKSKGANIRVAQVEAFSNGTFRPDAGNSEFAGKLISGAPGAPVSAHATTIGSLYYGNTMGLAPRVRNISILDHDTFLTTGGLRLGTSMPPLDLNVSVINNSWIAAYGQESFNIEAIRRLDWMIDRDDVVVVNAVDNGAGSAFPKLLASSYNGISVGVESGNHSYGPVNLDGAARLKPDLVAPAGNTSEAAAMVSGAAALLLSEAKARRMSLGEMGAKALLMAGAERDSDWRQGEEGESDDARHPLDLKLGAGSLRVDRSFRLMAAGEQNPGAAKTSGWDEGRLPKKSKRGLGYRFKFGRSADEFSAVLTWNRQVTQMGALLQPKLIDLDLALYRKSGKKWKQVERSRSDVDNVEMLVLDDLVRGVYMLQVIGQRPEDYGLAWSIDVGKSGPGNSRLQQSLMTAGTTLSEKMMSETFPSGISAATLSAPAVAAPEPSGALLLAAAAGLLMRRHRRPKRAGLFM